MPACALTSGGDHSDGDTDDNGTNDDCSASYGVEGVTRDARIQQIRLRQSKNMLAVLLFSRGVPMLLNTSFNLHGYPIVSRPEDALDVVLLQLLYDRASKRTREKAADQPLGVLLHRGGGQRVTLRLQQRN